MIFLCDDYRFPDVINIPGPPCAVPGGETAGVCQNIFRRNPVHEGEVFHHRNLIMTGKSSVAAHEKNSVFFLTKESDAGEKAVFQYGAGHIARPDGGAQYENTVVILADGIAVWQDSFFGRCYNIQIDGGRNKAQQQDEGKKYNHGRSPFFRLLYHSKAGEEMVNIRERNAGRMMLYDWMKRELVKMERKYPALLQIRSAGRSADGRRILEAALGNDRAPVHVLVQASMHGREYINTKLAVRQLWHSLEHGDMETYPHVCLHVLPMVNPDGVTISQTGINGIRNPGLKRLLQQCKQKDQEARPGIMETKDYWKRWKANARGVDLNRNFSAGWKEYRGPAAPSCQGYKGKQAESEPETQAVLSLHQRYPLACVLSYHSSGKKIFWDYGGSEKARKDQRRLAHLTAAATGYPLVSVRTSGQDQAGCSDYFVLHCEIPAVTIENGEGDCPLKEEEFPAIWQANRDLFQKVMGQY